MLVQEIQLQSLGIDALKGMYGGDDDFKYIYASCIQFNGTFHEDNSNFSIQEGLLFKGA